LATQPAIFCRLDSSETEEANQSLLPGIGITMGELEVVYLSKADNQKAKRRRK